MFVAGYPAKVDLQDFVRSCFYLLIISLCLFCIKTPLSEYAPRLEERATAIKVWVTVLKKRNKPQILIFTVFLMWTVFCDEWLPFLSDNSNA